MPGIWINQVSRRLGMPMKKLDTVKEEDSASVPGIGCYALYPSFSRRHRGSRSDFESYEDLRNMPARPSCHSSSNVHLERSHDQNSLLFQEKTLGQNSTITTTATFECPIRKPATELVKEIATLELEVIRLERYLLSLYRNAFDQYLAISPVGTEQFCESPSICQAGSPVKDAGNQMQDHSKAVNSHHPSSWNNSHADGNRLGDRKKKRESKSQQIGNPLQRDLVGSEKRTCHPTENLTNDRLKAASRHRSLADHLGASLMDHVCETPSKLSEEIVRCISAIYCKLANPLAPQIDSLTSPTSSLSSSSTFSPQDPCDNWSPRCQYESTASPYHSEGQRDRLGPYSGMTEVHKICIDGDRFNYAATMLQNFKALIRRLEDVDPRKMEHKEKLAFWINIHNALVMHAFLAYGLHQNHMKSTSSILKAAYNVGGHSINAYEIQHSIFGCQSHHPELRLRRLFSPGKKFTKGTEKHAYSLDHIEPLVHFALCLGAYSDPAVRVYTVKNISKELELARDDFVGVNVSIHRETKIILPRILYYYAKDASLDLSAIVEMVHDCMSKTQQKAIRECLRGGRVDKCIQWSSYKSTFRYIVHSDLAQH